MSEDTSLKSQQTMSHQDPGWAAYGPSNPHDFAIKKSPWMSDRGWGSVGVGGTCGSSQQGAMQGMKAGFPLW